MCISQSVINRYHRRNWQAIPNRICSGSLRNRTAITHGQGHGISGGRFGCSRIILAHLGDGTARGKRGNICPRFKPTNG